MLILSLYQVTSRQMETAIMGMYAILIVGQGFSPPSEVQIEGFYVTVFVEAEDADRAISKALTFLVREDREFLENIAPYADPDRAEVAPEHWYELSSFDGCELPRSGFVFFGKEDDASPPARTA
jgi:hypothetical protein